MRFEVLHPILCAKKTPCRASETIGESSNYPRSAVIHLSIEFTKRKKKEAKKERETTTAIFMKDQEF